MKAIVQRVLSARVLVGGKAISSIDRGLLVLIGINRDDTQADADYIKRKILQARLFDSEDGKKSWARGVKDVGAQVLLVSQFTLYAKFKGNKPDFNRSMAPAQAKAFYEDFVKSVRESYKSEFVHDGEFGAMMQVELVNDGPVTISLETDEIRANLKPDKKKPPVKQKKPKKKEEGGERPAAAAVAAVAAAEQ